MSELNAKEISWIVEFKEKGADLVNQTRGGDGGYNDGLHKYNTREWTEEERRLQSDRMTEWHTQRKLAGHPNCLGSPEAQARRKDSWLKWLHSEGKEKISESLKRAWEDPIRKEELLKVTKDPVRNAKISKANKKRYENPEERIKTGAAVSNGMTVEGKQRISKATLERHGYSEPMKEIPCGECGKLFMPNRRTKQTCSEECRRLLSAKKRSDTMKRKKNG